MSFAEDACKLKKTYQSWEAAKFFAGIYHQKIYKCPICGKFHLTAQGRRNILSHLTGRDSHKKNKRRKKRE